MAELIEFPDAEDAARLWITALFAANPNYTDAKAHAGRKPATLPATWVFVHRTGGVARDLVTDVPRLTFEHYAPTLGSASQLAGFIRSHLFAAEREGVLGSLTIYEVEELSGPYDDPDPDRPTANRVSATYQIAVRGS